MAICHKIAHEKKPSNMLAKVNIPTNSFHYSWETKGMGKDNKQTKDFVQKNKEFFIKSSWLWKDGGYF